MRKLIEAEILRLKLGEEILNESGTYEKIQKLQQMVGRRTFSEVDFTNTRTIGEDSITYIGGIKVNFTTHDYGIKYSLNMDGIPPQSSTCLSTIEDIIWGVVGKMN